MRWEAGPWAGKSALMSWLVLHPPPGTWVISFFVTARLAAQADSTAFTDGLLDQLVAVTGGEQVPPSASALQRDGLRRQLLEEAAARAVKVGRRLVLVVDGLDEDCGSMPGSGLPSIAACLPKRPPDGLRVIVTGRPDPSLPADVDPGHPLHRCRVRPMDVSPHATEVMRLAQRELDEVLATDKAPSRRPRLPDTRPGHRQQRRARRPRPAAADRPPSLRDRPAPARRVRAHHRRPRRPARRRQGCSCSPTRLSMSRPSGASGRTPSPASPGACTPGLTATGTAAGPPTPRNTCYTDTPACSPAPAMPAASSALATDSARHHRMLEATGGDAAALAEIAATHALITTSPSPDLLAALRLAWHREQLTNRNAHIPAQLPAVWATLGQPIRAEALPGPSPTRTNRRGLADWPRRWLPGTLAASGD